MCYVAGVFLCGGQPLEHFKLFDRGLLEMVDSVMPSLQFWPHPAGLDATLGDGLLLAHFARMTDEELAGYDVAALNLHAAVGLPGAEDMPIRVMLEILDRIAGLVERRTREDWHYFEENLAKYRYSPSFFRAMYMAEVLQARLQMRYNPAHMPDPDAPPRKNRKLWKDSQDLFIHGLLTRQTGTCTSMPVLYLAIGRRLGYPLSMVHAGMHYFLRWEEPDGGECFNVDATTFGLSGRDDEHYREIARTLGSGEIVGMHALPSLSPRQEMAAFLCARADCLRDNGRLGRAIEFYYRATLLDPDDLYSELEFLACLKVMYPAEVRPYLYRIEDVGLHAERRLFRGRSPSGVAASANEILFQLTTG